MEVSFESHRIRCNETQRFVDHSTKILLTEWKTQFIAADHFDIRFRIRPLQPDERRHRDVVIRKNI